MPNSPQSMVVCDSIRVISLHIHTSHAGVLARKSGPRLAILTPFLTRYEKECEKIWARKKHYGM